MVLLTMCLAVLVAQVGTSVVNLAVRPIGADLGAGVAGLQWVIDAYNLLYAVLLLTGGLLSDLWGRRRVFMVGVLVFGGASLLCAAAPGVGILIVGRALAGVGAALLLPASLAIIRVVWSDPAERGRALGVWASCNGVAFAIGPTVGGVLILRVAERVPVRRFVLRRRAGPCRPRGAGVGRSTGTPLRSAEASVGRARPWRAGAGRHRGARTGPG